MNRLDPVSGQLVARPPRSRVARYLRGGTWSVFGLALLGAVGLGLHMEANPTEVTARTLVELPLTLLLLDLWALGIALFRQSQRTPLRVPVKTPPILAAFHLGLWAGGRYTVSFDLFYRLEPADTLGGLYVVRGGAAALLGLLALLALGAAFFEARLVNRVLISEDTAAVGQTEAPEAVSEPDRPAGPEHVYEAQVILHNLGYDVGGIDGEMKEACRDALRQFQVVCELEPSGEVTVLTMIELRNRWSAREASGQSVKALFGHVAQRTGARLATWWQRRKA